MAGAAGNGLYEPFPGPVPKARAQHYVAGIAPSVTPVALEHGVFTRGSRAAPTLARGAGEPASARAGRMLRGVSPGWWQAALALAAGAALAGLGHRRLRSSAP